MTPTRTITVLNVDTNEQGRAELSKELIRQGFLVREAATEETALEAVKTDPPSVILLDLNLLDAFRLCRQIKSEPSTSEIPVIETSTTFTDSRLLIQGYQNSADHCVVKPVSTDVLVAIMESLVRRRRLYARRELIRKLEATGRLTKEAAKGLDTALMGLMGNLGLALESTSDTSTVQPLLKAALEAANRIVAFSKTLFGRGASQRLIVEPQDLSTLVRTLEDSIRVLLPPQAELILELQDGLPPAQADASQIEDLLIHLVKNAAEEIGAQRAGTITIATTAGDLDERTTQDYLGYERISAGRYVFLQVRDSGNGIDENHAASVFDPFFSTKETGWGMGLPAVLDILRRHRGGINVSSVRGEGTTFTVCLEALG